MRMVENNLFKIKSKIIFAVWVIFYRCVQVAIFDVVACAYLL